MTTDFPKFQTKSAQKGSNKPQVQIIPLTNTWFANRYVYNRTQSIPDILIIT
ncbi:MAG: hypothetical protein HY774_25760 [Acidobacteria bacterium]|nr:hypothetical protein [Acidobacteriota bacterium]